MNFLDRVLLGVRKTWYEFQAGPTGSRPQKKTKKQKAKKNIPRFLTPKLQTVPKPEPKPLKKKLRDSKRLKTKLAVLPPLEREGDERASWNEVIDTPQERVTRIENDSTKKKVRQARRFYPNDMSKKARHLLFMGPGDTAIQKAVVAITSGAALPSWAIPFEQQLELRNGRLFFEKKRLLMKDEKRAALL